MPPPMFPKVAVVCGAHTELGKLVVRDLLRSRDVALVHAVSTADIRDGISATPRSLRKLRLYIDSLDYIEQTLKHHVTEADIAFVTLGCSRDDLSSRGAYAFHKDNFDIPRRFIEAMFDLGVQRIALLSAAGASPHTRGNEFLRVKGELVDVVIRLQREAGRFAPSVALFRVPLLLTNKIELQGGGKSVPVVNKIKQHAILKFDIGASQAVHIRDVAKAMVADALVNAEKEEESDLSFRFKKRQYDLTELTGPEIVDLANETRTLQKSSYQRRKDKETVAQRISAFAKQEGAKLDDEDDNEENEKRSSDSDDHNSSGSFSGTPPGDGRQQEASSNQGSPRVSIEDGVPSQNGRPASIDSGSIPSSRPSATIQNASAIPLGTVESLGQQLGRRLTRIRGNRMLPDIETMGRWRQAPSRPSVQHIATDINHTAADVGVRPQLDENLRLRESDLSPEDGTETHTNASGTDSMRSHSPGILQQGLSNVDDEELDEMRRDAFMEFREFPRRESYATSEPQQSDEAIHTRGRPQSYAAAGYLEESMNAAVRRGRLQYAQEPRKDMSSRRNRRDASRSAVDPPEANPIERLSALVGRIIAATDRPSQKRRTRAHRRMVVEEDLGFDEEEPEYDYEPLLRGNCDMREAGNVAI